MPATPGAPIDPDRVRRLRKWRRVLPLCAALLAMIAVEIGVRVADAQEDDSTLQVLEDLRGWALRPGFKGWVDTERLVWVAINRDGMHDRDHDLVKPKGAVRVAVLGDSYVQGVNVPVEKTFTSFLEQRLATCAQKISRQAELLNFGVGGYGTAQEYLTYRHHASRYRSDIVILAVYTANDIFNNHRALNEKNEMPYFVLRDNQLQLERPPAEVPAEAVVPWYQAARMSLTNRSVTASLVWDGYALLRAPFVPPQVMEVAPRDTGTSEWARLLYDPQAGPVVAEAWAVTEALIAALAGDVKQDGAEFWLVTLSNTEQVDPDIARRSALASRIGVEDLHYPDRRLRDFAMAQGIPVISLAEPLAAHAAAHGGYLNGGYNADYPRGTGHWTEAANDLAAGIVRDRLCGESVHLGGRD